jgi:hypothetical protein
MVVVIGSQQAFEPQKELCSGDVCRTARGSKRMEIVVYYIPGSNMNSRLNVKEIQQTKGERERASEEALDAVALWCETKSQGLFSCSTSVMQTYIGVSS